MPTRNVQTILSKERDEVIADLGTLRGFTARFLELGAYALICAADYLRLGLARSMVRDLAGPVRIVVIPSTRGEADAGGQQPPATLSHPPPPRRTTEIDR